MGIGIDLSVYYPSARRLTDISEDIIEYSVSHGQPVGRTTSFNPTPMRGVVVLDNRTGKFTEGFTADNGVEVLPQDFRVPAVTLMSPRAGSSFWGCRSWIETRSTGETTGDKAIMKISSFSDYAASKNVIVRQPLSRVIVRDWWKDWADKNSVTDFFQRLDILDADSIPNFITAGPFFFEGKLLDFLNRLATHCGGILLPRGIWSTNVTWTIGYTNPYADTGSRVVDTVKSGRVDAPTDSLLMNTTKNEAIYGRGVKISLPQFNPSSNYYSADESTGSVAGVLASIGVNVVKGVAQNIKWEPTWTANGVFDIKWASPIIQGRVLEGTPPADGTDPVEVIRAFFGSQIAGVTVRFTPNFTGVAAIDFYGIARQLVPNEAFRDLDWSGEDGIAYQRSVRDYGSQEMIVPQWLSQEQYESTMTYQRVALYRRYHPWRAQTYKFYQPSERYDTLDASLASGQIVTVDGVKMLSVGTRRQGGIAVPATYESVLLNLEEMANQTPDGEDIPDAEIPGLPGLPSPGDPEDPAPVDDSGDDDINDLLDEPPDGCTINNNILCIDWGVVRRQNPLGTWAFPDVSRGTLFDHTYKGGSNQDVYVRALYITDSRDVIISQVNQLAAMIRTYPSVQNNNRPILVKDGRYWHAEDRDYQDDPVTLPGFEGGSSAPYFGAGLIVSTATGHHMQLGAIDGSATEAHTPPHVSAWWLWNLSSTQSDIATVDEFRTVATALSGSYMPPNSHQEA